MFLATTADESTWNVNRPMLFLGEWCRRFSRRSQWQSLDVTVLPYHWDDREKYNSDYIYLEGLYEKQLNQLSDCLGQLHGVTHDIRYWRIVVGPWLRFFIDALFDRFETIRAAIETKQVTETWVLPYQLEQWTPADFMDFYRLYTDDPWNHIVFAEFMHAFELPISEMSSMDYIQPIKLPVQSQNYGKNFFKRALTLYCRLLPSKLNRIVLISSCLPINRVFQLQRALGQLPYPVSPKLSGPNNQINMEMRKALVAKSNVSLFEHELEKFITYWMPKAYVEDYVPFKKIALSEFPKSPHLIFTANAYQGDDGFKLWAGEHSLNGIPLVIGQHGGNMGISHHNQTEDHQVKIADTFASWGWNSILSSNIQPFPSLQLRNTSIESANKGDILLTLASMPRYFYCHYSIPVAGQFQAYIKDQIVFLENLNTSVRKHIQIRLNGDEFGWNITERFKEAGCSGLLDKSVKNLNIRLRDCRICVSTYNATVFLETMAANFPTLMFWNSNLFDFRQAAIPFMKRIRDVGIFHESPASAACLLNEISDDIGAWWFSPNIQAAREEFINCYACGSNDWINIWRKKLKSMTYEHASTRQ